MLTSPIVCTPEICGGAPRLEGTRLTVEEVVGNFAVGKTIAELAEDYGQQACDIEAMVRVVCRAAYHRHGMYLSVYRRVQAPARR